MSPGPRTAILLLGMHRSGTSALTGALAQCGVALPKNLLPANFANERGYFESLPLMAFHDELLAAAGSAWNDWRAFRAPAAPELLAGFRGRAREVIAQEFGDAPLFALKDPRICRFVPFWLDVFAETGVDVRILSTIRNSREVALSLAARNKMPVEEGVLLWLRHALDAERATRGLPRAFVRMDELLDDWRSVLGRIGHHAAIAWPALDEQTDEMVSDFLTRDLKHQNVDDSTIATGWEQQALNALQTLCNDPHETSAQAALDLVSAGFESACSLFEPLVARAPS